MDTLQSHNDEILTLVIPGLFRSSSDHLLNKSENLLFVALG